MTKLTTSDLANLRNETSATSTINTNFAAVETAMENTLSRDGTTPNSMAADLDMDSNRILNLPKPINGAEPLRLQDAATLNGGGTISAYPQASYVVIAADGDLTSERVLTAGANITITDGGAGSTVTIASAAGLTDGDKGDITVSGSGATWTLDTVNANVGTFGSATAASQVTVNAKGLVTAASDVTVTPAVGSITGLGAGIATWLATPSSANLIAAVTNETGTGSLVFATSPTLVTPVLGTPTSGTLTNCTGLPQLDSTGSAYVQIDSNNDTTNAVFQVRNNSATGGGGSLLMEVSESGQVAVGATVPAQFRQFYVLGTDTTFGASDGHAAIECRLDFQPTADTSANPDGVYGTLWYNAARNFTGAGAAVRGNAYTIAQPAAAAVNVTNLIGTYGRARHEAAGTVTNAIGLFADGAQNAGTGTITNGMGIWIDSQTAATNNYGVYFENNPNLGSLGAPTNVSISTRVDGTGVITWLTAGGTMTLSAAGGLSLPSGGGLTIASGAAVPIVTTCNNNTYVTIGAAQNTSQIGINFQPKDGSGVVQNAYFITSNTSFQIISPPSGNVLIGENNGSGGINTAIQCGSAQEVYFPGIGTTGSAANAFLNSGSSPANQLLRSTSSLRYKRNIEPMQPSLAAKLIDEAKPIWYQSTAPADRADWSWYGLGAEDVALIDPRMVHWGYAEEDWEIINPGTKEQEKRLKSGAQLIPDGVMYERFVVPLLVEVQALKKRVAVLEAAMPPKVVPIV